MMKIHGLHMNQAKEMYNKKNPDKTQFHIKEEDDDGEKDAHGDMDENEINEIPDSQDDEDEDDNEVTGQQKQESSENEKLDEAESSSSSTPPMATPALAPAPHPPQQTISLPLVAAPRYPPNSLPPYIPKPTGPFPTNSIPQWLPSGHILYQGNPHTQIEWFTGESFSRLPKIIGKYSDASLAPNQRPSGVIRGIPAPYTDPRIAKCAIDGWVMILWNEEME